LNFDQIADALTSLATGLLRQPTLKADLERLVRQVSGLTPSCSGAGISLLVDGESTIVNATDRVILEVGLVYHDLIEGPRLAAFSGQPIRMVFVPEDQPFLHDADGAADSRILSVLSIPLRQDGTRVGTLDLYSHDNHAFDTCSEEEVRALAAETVAALVRTPLYEQAHATRQLIQDEHDTSDQISMAQGVLMETHDCTASQALTLLHHASDTNREHLLHAAQRILSAVQ